MAKIDPAYIQPIQHRPTPVNVITQVHHGIPTIDLISLSSSTNHHSKYSPLITSIRDACTNWGFFQVTNHGVPLNTLHNLNHAALTFFSLPDDDKRKVSRDETNPLGYYDSEHTKNVRDWKQVFDFTAKDPTLIPVSPDDLIPKQLINRWPRFPPHLKEAAQTYAIEVEKLAFKLMELIAVSLELEPNRLNGFFEEDHTSFVRLNYYPPCPSPHLVLGVTRHKDAGGLTILAQDDVGGLQVRRKSDGEWVSIKPDPAALIINIGDVIQVWSNDKYESVEHRVVVNSHKERISIPFFFNPAHYVMIKPLEELVDGHNPAKYREYNYGAFYATKRNSNLKKLNVDNLQISHFKITE
ncbi:protein LATERAL BRANCHING OXIDOREDUCTASE 1-like [Silene latifolia]|uniref:protein LATERAL BRANCHING OXIDOREDUCTASE 1-like n=1 Tax=Silene latifolia TaxID=37657 RepID=UPI003D77888D